MILIRQFSHEFHFDPLKIPEWSKKVDRWYQLDEASFGLVDAYFANIEELIRLPDLLILASEQGSAVTDFAFAETGAASPSLFVHTLPNIRSAPLLQSMGWHGPVLCVQKGEQTLLSALIEAVEFSRNSSQRVWVLSVKKELRLQSCRVMWFETFESEKDPTPGDFEVAFNKLIGKNWGTNIQLHDEDLTSWFVDSQRKEDFPISKEIEIKRR